MPPILYLQYSIANIVLANAVYGIDRYVYLFLYLVPCPAPFEARKRQ